MYQSTRSVIYYDRNTGNRHTCPDALGRFYRLHWGGWIRKRAGAKRGLWRKPWYLRWYGRQHIFVKNSEASKLEKMIDPKYKKVRHFVDDIYNPYHSRTNYDCCPRGKSKISSSYINLLFKN